MISLEVSVLEGLVQVVDDILSSLDTDRDTDEGVSDAQRGTVLGADRAVGHDSRHLNEGLNTTKGLSEGDDLELAEHLVDVLKGALHAEGEHTTEALLLATGQVVLGVGRQTGVDHLIHLGVGLKELGDLERVLLVALHAHLEGHQTTTGEVAVERGRNSTERVLHEGELIVDGVTVGDSHAHDNIGVTVDILGHRVHDNVRTEAEGVLEVRAHEGVVHDKERAVRVCVLGHSGNIDEAKGRVRGRLDPDKLKQIFCFVSYRKKKSQKFTLLLALILSLSFYLPLCFP